METEPIDPQQEKRRLRAAAEGMRSKQLYAKRGVMMAGLIAASSFQMKQMLPAPPRMGLICLALILPVISAIPFLRSLCPQCKRQYHSFMSIFQSPENSLSCKSCGFHIDKHITRY